MTDYFDTLVSEAEEKAKAMQGWDFSYLEDRRHEDRPTWDYAYIFSSMLGGVCDMLDFDHDHHLDLVDYQAFQTNFASP